MTGITMDELYERLSWGHDVEFTYHGEEYVIQQEEDGKKLNMVIWESSPNANCICKHLIPSGGQIPIKCIEAVLDDKCFEGKSFMEIEADITIDAIL